LNKKAAIRKRLKGIKGIELILERRLLVIVANAVEPADLSQSTPRFVVIAQVQKDMNHYPYQVERVSL
jgi:hypothetical protein